MGDPGVLARGTPDQTALQDWSWGWVLSWASSGSEHIGRVDSQSEFQAQGPLILCCLLRCWAGLGWGWWVSHVGGCLLLHSSLPSSFSLLNTEVWEILVCLLPLLLNPLFGMSPLGLGSGLCLDKTGRGLSELGGLGLQYFPCIHILAKGLRDRYQLQVTWGQGWRTY